VEPYVVAADIGGVAPYVGRGGWTWHTGSAAWLWRFGVERILGVRPEQGGVRIEPCLPPHWRRASVTLKRASGTLAIAIENPDGVSTGIVECRVDGVAQEQAIVAFPTDGRERRVTIRLGRVAPGSSRAAEHVPAPDAAIV
jgi:cyclic beta-1,2-glucan synthetase